MPFVNHSDGGEHLYGCDPSSGGNCCSTSDETEQSTITEQEGPFWIMGTEVVAVTYGNVGERKQNL